MDLFDESNLTEVKPDDYKVFQRMIEMGEELVKACQRTGVRLNITAFPDGKVFLDAFYPGDPYKWIAANNVGILLGHSSEYRFERCLGEGSVQIEMEDINFEDIRP